MSLGQRLRPHLDAWIQAQQSDQNGLAMTWLESWNARNPKPKLSSTTVSPKLTRLLKDDDDGVRFFFKDRARGALLLDLLGVDGEEHAALMALAATQLDGELPARMVIEMGELPANRDVCDVVFAGMERLLRAHRSMLPAVLVLTQDQYRNLPRSYDDLGDQLRLIRANDAEGCAELAMGLVKDDMLLVSTRALGRPYTGWAGIGVYVTKQREDTDDELHRDSGLRFRLDPPDALEVFASAGRLPDLPPVKHTLAALGVEAGHHGLPWDSRDGAARREMMRLLADESRIAPWAKSGWMAMHRQAWAEYLGVPATSSAEERLEHELAQLVSRLGLPVERGDNQELKLRIERAKRRPVPPTLLRVGDRIHAINPPDDLPEHPRLKCWRLSCAEPAITRIRQATAMWTEEDLVLDRDLSGLVRRLDPEGLEPTAFLHARATLLHGDLIKPRRGDLISDWSTALGSLLADDPPAPRLRLTLNRDKVDYAPDAKRSPFLALLSGDKLSYTPGPSSVLTWLPFLGPLEVSAQDRPVVVEPVWDRYYRSPPPADPDALVLIAPPGRKDLTAEDWLDSLDWSTALGGGLPPKLLALQREARKEEEESRQQRGYYGGRHQQREAFTRALEELYSRYLQWSSEPPRWNVKPIVLPDAVWAEASRLVPLAWVLLRRGLRRGEGLRLPSGEVLMPVGGPLAVMATIEHGGPPDAPVRVMLRSEVSEATDERSGKRFETAPGVFREINLDKDTVAAPSTSDLTLPSELMVVGRGVVARFRFVASALLGVENRPY